MAISNNSTGLRPGVCTSTTRPTAPYEGQMIYETDTDLTYVWGGSAWQQVSGGTAVGNSGLVYIASVSISGTSTTLTNCFSTTYDNYRVVLRILGSTGNNIYLKWNGSTGNTYNSNGFYTVVGTAALTATSEATSSNGINIGYTNPSYTSCTFDITAPFLAQVTTSSSMFAGGTYMGVWNGIDTNAASSTNLTITTSPSSTGTITIYGYRK